MIIRFIHAGCGDAIHIRFEERPDQFRNILIDGGTEKGDIYDKGLKKVLEGIAAAENEKIDLWIISHIDDDHIGGILRLLKDEETLDKLDLSQTQFWYNYAKYDYDTGIRTDQKKNVAQAIRLRDWLMSGSPVNQFITDAMVTLDLWGAKCSVLSPNQPMMERLLRLWSKEELVIRQQEVTGKKTASGNDYKTRLSDFDLTKEYIDQGEENNSSIAFALEYRGERILFSADAKAALLTAGLRRLGGGKPVLFKYVQVPHHGSKYNISDELLQLIDCREYIITGDGFNRSSLPNKYTLAKILCANTGQEVIFHLTEKNALTNSIFNVDKESTFDVRFPAPETNYLTFNLGDPACQA
ncbi:Metal-dependent hydrolase, beta-lactamase superfamily II [Mucilaginibacter pineti]|uniref:Metal-dependent hydrolase, beta-lactamase superfamily II n=1 Tax=Mucilaginibacter pineti TaxID=1391627 RepID=A0A1G7C6S1_9SPHI|nr:MBL fold metallo-hydrolase [Mucilaginibacter pineti]SDE34913.1 Metal-dependent hydrolase, beta-lactamase superfamily II [Mucilaginibacter pineti]